MPVRDILAAHATTMSFEFFPPKTAESTENLLNTLETLKKLSPAYVSVTYGAGGTTRNQTHDLVVRIQQESGIPVVGQLTWVGSSRSDMAAILDRYAENGITDVLALRGDKPKDAKTWEAAPDGFAHAAELVDFIKKRHPAMGIGVAGFPEGHPECPNRLQEMDYLKAKVDSGADYICTQLFFDNRDFYDFRERCVLAGIHVPIVAGIMPVASVKNLKRMAELSAGSRFPARLLRSLGRANSDEEVEKIGQHWAAEQVRDLLDNEAKGIHFYTLNKSETVLAINQAIGIGNSQQFDKRP